MRIRNNSLVSLAIAGVITLGLTISCTRIQQVSSGTAQSEKLKSFNFDLPAGYNTADPDPRLNDSTNFLVLIDASGQIYLNDPDSPPIDLPTLVNAIKARFATLSPGHTAYIGASAEVDSKKLWRVLSELKEHNVNHVKLLVKSRPRPENKRPQDLDEVSGADRVFQISLDDRMSQRERPNPLTDAAKKTEIETGVIREKVSELEDPMLYGEGPNPLTLVVEMSEDKKPVLNNEVSDDEEELKSKLAEIFHIRERDRVLRKNSNEVEKTLLISMSTWYGSGKGTIALGRILRIVEAAKSVGASPIVLVDEVKRVKTR